jgi:hypothetical protein
MYSPNLEQTITFTYFHSIKCIGIKIRFSANISKLSTFKFSDLITKLTFTIYKLILLNFNQIQFIMLIINA